MRLRKLMAKDAEHMLEWMHDQDVVKDLSGSFATKQLDDCKRFIEQAQDTNTDLNLAIVDDSDEYMGTVSLKHIDRENSFAEFAIAIRAKAMGHGYSSYGMKEIIRLGHEEYGLATIYWCVGDYNKRAIRFYDKNGYVRTTDVPDGLKTHYSKQQLDNFYWYKA